MLKTGGTMRLNSRLVLGLLAFAAIVLAASNKASASTVDFTCASCIDGSTISSFTENGYTVTSSLGTWNWNSSSKHSDGADISTFVPDRGDTNVITITKVGGGFFYFDSIEILGPGQSLVYTITGFDGSVSLFSFSNCSINDGQFSLCSNAADQSILVDSVTLSVYKHDKESPSVYVDNIELQDSSTPVPEPSSYMLFGSGLLGLALLTRSKVAADVQ
jgi:hypothetical protein